MTRNLTRDAFVAVLAKHTYIGPGLCSCDAFVRTARGYAEHVADVLFAAEVRA